MTTTEKQANAALRRIVETLQQASDEATSDLFNLDNNDLEAFLVDEVVDDEVGELFAEIKDAITTAIRNTLLDVLE